MTLKFYNTLTGYVDEFVPITVGKVSMYTCGPTVYDYAHIGNWASYIYWDTLVRILMANDYDVTRVMNITDVGHLTSDGDEGEEGAVESGVPAGSTLPTNVQWSMSFERRIMTPGPVEKT